MWSVLCESECGVCYVRVSVRVSVSVYVRMSVSVLCESECVLCE